MSLREYDRKRDFATTSEPAGKLARRRSNERQFVIQLHHARARHYDFRLEHEGVLLSWAVPKGPSLRPSDKRLAVQVEDHPLAYAGFEGTIPKGGYGAGTVRIVERGAWRPEGDVSQALADGKLDFQLQGQHLKGGWSLIRTARRSSKPQWLLVKHADDHAEDSDLDAVVAQQTDGPAGSTRGQVAAWSELAQAIPGAKLGRPIPALQLATLRAHAPEGDAWLHEIKWDGYRLLAWRDGDNIRLQSRNAIDWTGRFPPIEEALRALPLDAIMIDAELVVLNEDGYSDFNRLQATLEGVQEYPVSCVAFDLLWLDGVDLTGCRQLDRKDLLRDALASEPSPWLAYGEHILGHGPEVVAKAFADGSEGVISKRADATYEAGRTQSWIKIKRRDSLDAVIVGFTSPKGSRKGVGALLLAERKKAGLRYIGRVGTGMDQRVLASLRVQLDALQVDRPTVELPSHVPLCPRSVHWVRPRLMIEVEHRGWGKEGLLRQASFLRMRPDKAIGPSGAKVAAPVRRLTHPDRKVFSEPTVTKREVADYYEAVAPWLLEEVRGRPLSVLRAPDGAAGTHFFQKHVGANMGPGVKSVLLREKSGQSRGYLCIDDVQGLMSLVQMNALEFHPWGVVPGDPSHPDRVTFDLDPGDGVSWVEITAAAVDIRDHLGRAGLRSHALLSGGKGVHVVVPLEGSDGWPSVKRFARALATVLATDAPQRFVAVASKAKRPGRIFVDWLRNTRGATSIAPWSVRARAGAPVAMPVTWEALRESIGADDFRLSQSLNQLTPSGTHPWGPYRALPQRLPREETIK